MAEQKSEDPTPDTPSQELKDIALQSAGAASRAEDAAAAAKEKADALGDFADAVTQLTGEVRQLRVTLVDVASKEDLKAAQKRTARTLVPFVAVGMIVMLIVLGIGVALLRISSGNHRNGDLIVFCTTPPPQGTSVQELKKYECYLRGIRQQGEAIRQLQCNDLLTKGYWISQCDDVRETLVAQGIVLPPTSGPPPALGHPVFTKPLTG